MNIILIMGIIIAIETMIIIFESIAIWNLVFGKRQKRIKENNNSYKEKIKKQNKNNERDKEHEENINNSSNISDILDATDNFLSHDTDSD